MTKVYLGTIGTGVGMAVTEADTTAIARAHALLDAEQEQRRQRANALNATRLRGARASKRLRKALMFWRVK
jgi:hypothetical protein